MWPTSRQAGPLGARLREGVAEGRGDGFDATASEGEGDVTAVTGDGVASWKPTEGPGEDSGDALEGMTAGVQLARIRTEAAASRSLGRRIRIRVNDDLNSREGRDRVGRPSRGDRTAGTT